MISFGQRLKMLRREADYSQSDLSDRIGVSVQSISKWENDNTMPDISQIVPLAAVLGVSTDWLLGVGMNEDEDERELDNKVLKLFDTMTSNAYHENASYEAYAVQSEFLKKYPLNHRVRLDCASNLYKFLETGRKLHYYEIPEDVFTDLHTTGMKMLNMLLAQDKDPSRMIAARQLLIRYLILTKNWDDAEKIASELPESYEIRDEEYLFIACEKGDYRKAEELSKKVSKMRAHEYIKSLHLRARRISIYGDIRKKEAISAWKDMELAAREMARVFGDEMPELLDIIRNYLIDALACESGDYLVLSDVNSALDCVEEATRVAIDVYETAKARGYKDEKLAKFAKDCRWVPIMCYSKVIANEDNVLSREARYKACCRKLENLA